MDAERPERDVIFRQEPVPGQLGLSHLTDMGILASWSPVNTSIIGSITSGWRSRAGSTRIWCSVARALWLAESLQNALWGSARFRSSPKPKAVFPKASFRRQSLLQSYI